MITKILIYVEGGTVQYVHSNNENTRIVIIDKDNLHSDGNLVSGINEPDRIIENHYETFVEEDPIGNEIHHELKRLKF